MLSLDQSADPQYASITSGAQQGAAAGWGSFMNQGLIPNSALGAGQMQNAANSYMAQQTPGLMNTYMANNPALMGALQGSMAMAGGGSYTMPGAQIGGTNVGAGGAMPSSIFSQPQAAAPASSASSSASASSASGTGLGIGTKLQNGVVLSGETGNASPSYFSNGAGTPLDASGNPVTFAQSLAAYKSWQSSTGASSAAASSSAAPAATGPQATPGMAPVSSGGGSSGQGIPATGQGSLSAKWDDPSNTSWRNSDGSWTIYNESTGQTWVNPAGTAHGDVTEVDAAYKSQQAQGSLPIQPGQQSTPAQTVNVPQAQSLTSLMNAGNSMTPMIGGLEDLSRVQAKAGQQLQGYAQGLQQGSPLLQQQNLQAQQELATNGRLSNQEMSTIQQQTAGQFSSSGLGGSSANIADQALNLEQAQNARLMQYQANATNVQGENTQNSAAAVAASGASTNAFNASAGDLSFAGSIAGAQGSIFGQAGQLQNQANSNLFSLASLMQSPISSMQNSYLTGMNNYGTQAMQAGMAAPMSSQQVSPTAIQTMQDFYNTQYNAQAAANNANAAGQSAQSGAMVAGGASIAAAGITAVAIF
jgi:hypothetical protein